jgi:tetratricopeptide (TPR) repeat protein
LHGHTADQRPVTPADALASLLLTAGVAAWQIPSGIEARARMWRDHLSGKRVLLLLDDAAGHEQVRPLLPGTAGSLVLVTSRRHLTDMEDAHVVGLDTLPPEDAAVLLIRLAGRPELTASDTAVGQINMLCGFLPLAIGMVAGQLRHHPAWTADGLGRDLATARSRLELIRAENLSVAAAFDLSYRDLTADQQQSFRRLGLHPGEDIDAYAVAALADTDLTAARRLLEDLYDHHLLTEPTAGRYRMHDLIHEHASLLAVLDPDDDGQRAGRRLVDYYLHTAAAAARFLARRSPAPTPQIPGTLPRYAPGLASREDANSWMHSERLNLYGIAGYASRRGWHSDAIAFSAALHGYLRSQGYWDEALAMHNAALDLARHSDNPLAEAIALTDIGELQYLGGDGDAAASSLTQALELYRRLSDKLGEASALNELGALQRATGQHVAAIASHQEALRLYRELGNRLGEASALNDLGDVQQATGDLRAAAASHRRALQLYRELDNQLGEASALNRLGKVQQAAGDYKASAVSHEQALRLNRALGQQIGEARALIGLGIVEEMAGDLQSAILMLMDALSLHRQVGYQLGEARALSRLGFVQHEAGDYAGATETLTRALELHRQVGYRPGEARALNRLGLLQQAMGNYPAAATSHERALQLHRDIGDRVGEATALASLSALQQTTGQLQDAVAYMTSAIELYRATGARYDEATSRNAMGDLLLACWEPDKAHTQYEQALAIATEIASGDNAVRARKGISECRLRASLSDSQIAAG